MPTGSSHASMLAWGAAVLTVLGAVVLGATTASAGVKTSTVTRAYHVGGSTASALVSYMRSRPFHGDRGNAVANIRPAYSLSVATRTAAGSCKAKVTLSIRFTMTLPQARTAGMSASTRSAWGSFAAYARRHEETHKRIYIQCGNAFVAKAERMSAGNCAALQASIRRLLETDKRACEKRQLAFDRAERGRVLGLSLFKLAKAAPRNRR